MKILIVSGFLGAGKTTFIKSLVEHTGHNFVVCENEFGDVNVDGAVLDLDSSKNSTNDNQTSSGEIEVWELTEGCICCSMQGDFRGSVLTIANAIDPDYLIVEPTGVGFLGNIVEDLLKITYERLQLLYPVTVVDAKNWKRQRFEFKECWENQVANASVVLISKSENLSKEERQEIVDVVLSINPNAKIPNGLYQDEPDEFWDHLLTNNMPFHGAVSSDKNSKVQNKKDALPLQSVSLSGSALENPDQLYYALEQISWGACGEVTRCKGFVPYKVSSLDKTQWLHFEYVEGLFEIYGVDPDKKIEKERTVFIGHHMDMHKIAQLFGKASINSKSHD